MLGASAINVAPLNQVPRAVVSLMDRTNVETVIVAGTIRKWKGLLLERQSEQAARRPRRLTRLSLQCSGISQDVFRSN